MTNFKSISAICLALALLALTPPVRADSPATEPAKAHADRGMMYYNLSDWAAAIREYRAAFEADPRPDYLFAKGQAERQSGDCGAAISSYKAFLRTTSGSSSRIAATESLIHECEQKLEDARIEERTRRLEELHKLERDFAARHDRPHDAPVSEATSPQPTTKSSNKRGLGDPAGIILSVGGILVAGAGTTLFLVGNSGMANAAHQSTYGRYESRVSTAKTERTLGLVGIGVGAALFSAGIIRYIAVISHEKSVVAHLEIRPDRVLVHGQF